MILKAKLSRRTLASPVRVAKASTRAALVQVAGLVQMGSVLTQLSGPTGWFFVLGRSKEDVRLELVKCQCRYRGTIAVKIS